MNKKYMICEAPLCVGAPTRGSEYAFTHMMRSGLPEIFGDAADYTYYTAERFMPRSSEYEKYGRRLRQPETVMHVNREHYKNLLSAFRRGYMPITVGGDHSIAMASIAAASETVGADNIAVIYIDGHADINTEETTESGYIHGMPLAAAMGLCCDGLTVGKNKVNLFGKNTYIVGARSIDKGEYPIIEREKVSLYTACDVKKRGYSDVMDEIIEKTRGMNVHISFDVDSIDGGEFPATGYVMPDGMSFETVFLIMKRLLSEVNLTSFDCVEYNPSLDFGGKCLEKLYRIFSLF